MNDILPVLWQRSVDRMAELPRLIGDGLGTGPVVYALSEHFADLPARLLALNLATGVLLAAALLANRALERRVHASARIALFAAVFARVLLPADWSSPLGLLEPGGAAVAIGLVRVGVPVGSLPIDASAFAALWLPGLYLVGVVVLLARWRASRRALDHRLRGAVPIAPALRAQLAPASQAVVLVHPSEGPLVAGVLRPRVVLPQAVLSGDPERLAFVLGHELAHVRRRDHLLAALVQIGSALAWPIVPLWLAARQMRTLMELACDEEVLGRRGGDARRRYGELLIELSIGRPRAITPAFTLDLRARLRALPRRRRWHLAAQHGAIAGLVALCLACSGVPSGATEEPAAPTANEAPAPAASEARPPMSEREETDAAAIARDIRQRMPEVRACYEHALRTNQVDRHLRLDLIFTVNEDGRLSAVRVAGPPSSATLTHCLVERARTWVFSPPKDGPVEAAFPLILMGRDD